MKSRFLDAPSRSHVAIVGRGTMGADVAVAFLRVASAVVMLEPNVAVHAGILKRIQSNLEHCQKVANLTLLSIVDDF